MTTLREAAQQALEALEGGADSWQRVGPAIESLRAALAEPVQEPVAWRYQDARGNYRYRGYVQGFDVEYAILKPVALYAAPPQRKPLTEEEIREMFFAELRALPSYPSAIEELPERLARAIERKHEITP